MQPNRRRSSCIMECSDYSIRYNTETGEPYIFKENIKYAGFFVRLAAYLLDLIIVAAASAPILLLLSLIPFMDTKIFFVFTAKAIVVYLLKALYFVLFLKLRGATPGKLALRIRVVKKEGELSWIDAVYRETVGRYLSGLVLSLGYLMVGFSRTKQGLHDMLCDTVVIYNI